MDNKILLRFRDMTTDTIREHNAVVEKSCDKKVLWGWWKKERELFPNPILFEMMAQLEKSSGSRDNTIFFINSGTKTFFEARLYKIHYKSNTPFQPGEVNGMCPDYYKGAELYAWFEIGEITEIKTERLEDYVISPETPSTNVSEYTSVLQERIGLPLDTTELSFLQDDVSFWVICKKENLMPDKIAAFPYICNKTYYTGGEYILHLSDIHFGKNHAYNIPKGKKNVIGRESAAEALIRDLEEQGIKRHEVALVLITGDITATASPHEFNEAKRFGDEIKQNLGLGAGQIIWVPGNHDIEWLDSSSNLNEDAELNFINFSDSFYGSRSAPALCRFNEFYINGSKVAIAALNSCRLESREDAGIGFVGAEQLREMDKYLKGDKYDYVIAMFHHHVLPVNYTEYYSTEKKSVSLMLDAEAVLQSLIGCGVNTALHGHQHQPYYSTIHRYSGVDGADGDLNIIGGGSFGANIASLNSIGRNTYHIMTLDNGSSGLQLRVRLRVRNANGTHFTTVWEQTF